MDPMQTVGTGGHTGAAAEDLDKIGRSTKTGAPCDLGNIVLCGQKVVFRNLYTIKDQILMQTAAGFLPDQIAQMVRMIVKMVSNAFVGQGWLGKMVVYVRKDILADLGASQGGILMDQFQQAQF